MRAFPIACLVFAACSGARPIPAADRNDSCASVVHRIERTAPFTEQQKATAFEELQGHTVEWSVRVLAVSEFADNLDGPRSFSVDAECDNVARDAGAGLRYLMTLYVSEPHAAGLEELRRGTIVPVRATLRRYEGRNAFSAKGYLLTDAGKAPPPAKADDSSAPEAAEAAKSEAEPEAKPKDVAPPAAAAPSEGPKGKETDRTKPKAPPPRAKPRGR